MQGYELSPGAPSVAEYLRLRKEAGLSVKSHDQAVAAIDRAWWAVHVRDEKHRSAVGMGRVIGDGGWYFHIIDMAVLPEHQRRGIGDAILTALLRHVADNAPGGAFVSLLADPPGRRLYERHGFVPTAPDSVGMRLPA
jgi:ribosomal protein S18 acetylase RimI-like enzyme